MKNIILSIPFFLLTVISYSQSKVKSMLRLPGTGVKIGYTNTFGEDNDFNINPPFFLINGNGTVTDTVTGLMWQQLDGGEITFEGALQYCDTLNLGGFSNWRLPTAHEAFSILNHGQTNPALDISVFPKTLAEYWWTSDRQVNDSIKIWVTNSGGGIGNHLKTETISAGGTKKIHVRAVRDRTTPIVIQNQFTDNGNGTITDNLTGLIWQKNPISDTLNWEQALTYADTLSLSGSSDWRLPNVKELQSINDETFINPSINKTYFNVSSAQKYWSSTTLPNQTTKAWYLNTQFGITTYDNKTVKHYVICVKGNQTSTGINEIHSTKLLAFPNPFSSRLILKNTTNNEIYELMSSFGGIVYSGKYIEQEDFSYLPRGIYFLKIFDKTVSVIKLIKE